MEEKLDTLFSAYTRLRFADWKGDVHCYTCGDIFFWKHGDCGHFIGRGNEAIRWDIDNTRPQCRYCNRMQGGMNEVFEEELREELGEERYSKLIERSKGRYPDSVEVERLVVYYSDVLKRNPLYTK